MCCFYICSLFSFHMFLCTNFKTERCESYWIRDGRIGTVRKCQAKMASDFQVWESAKTCKVSPSMVLISLAFWNLRLIIQTSLFEVIWPYCHWQCHFNSFHVFFPAEVAGSHTIRWHRGFFVWKDVGIWECDNSSLWTCSFTPFWWLWMNIWPWHVKPQARPCFSFVWVLDKTIGYDQSSIERVMGLPSLQNR